MRKKQKATVRAICIISRELFQIRGKAKDGVIRLNPDGQGFEILSRLSQGRRRLVLNKVKCILEVAPYVGDEEAISIVTSYQERRGWVVADIMCEEHDNLICVMKKP